MVARMLSREETFKSTMEVVDENQVKCSFVTSKDDDARKAGKSARFEVIFDWTGVSAAERLEYATSSAKIGWQAMVKKNWRGPADTPPETAPTYSMRKAIDAERAAPTKLPDDEQAIRALVRAGMDRAAAEKVVRAALKKAG